MLRRRNQEEANVTTSAHAMRVTYDAAIVNDVMKVLGTILPEATKAWESQLDNATRYGREKYFQFIFEINDTRHVVSEAEAHATNDAYELLCRFINAL